MLNRSHSVPRKHRLVLRSLLTLGAFFCLAASAQAATLNVPSNAYPTIQSAIDGASSTTIDTIVVAAGVYQESLSWSGKNIIIQGAGENTCTIDPSGGTGGRCLSTSGLSSASSISGFTLQNGYVASGGGGGMLNSASSPTVTHCTFSHNTADGAWPGGGMYNPFRGSPTVSNCTFSNNTALFGSGMYTNGGSPVITNCTFSGNSGGSNGAGGGMYNYGGSAVITNCTFSGNSEYAGGGMYNQQCSPTIANCAFLGNSGTQGGGMINFDSGNARVINCVFQGNSAFYGGSAFNQTCTPVFTNCTISHNTATWATMYNLSSNPTITNCILWGNTAPIAPGIANQGSVPLITYSDVQDFANTSPDSNGNFDSDPVFVDADGADNIVGTSDDNLRLQANSPCRNAGNSTPVQSPPFPTVAGVIIDLAGNPRISESSVDIGAYEVQGNRAPVAVDDAYQIDEDTALVIPSTGILANDTDADGNALSSILNSGPAHGSLSLAADGSFIYTPDANYNGPDSFTYHANDGLADSNIATVNITVNAVNDAPVAVGDAYTTDEDTPFTIPVSGILGNDSDVDGDPLSSILNSGPAHGSLSLAADGSFVYTPDANYNGTDSFTYHANDGTADSNIATVAITVNPVNDAPVAVDDVYNVDKGATLTVPVGGILTNDSDVDGDAIQAILVSGPANGTLTLNPDGSFSYTPNASFFGNDSFTYKANDGQADSNTAMVTISVKQTVKDYSAQIASITTLKGQVQALITKKKLLPADGNSLISKLNAAIAALQANDPATAKIKLQDFINQVTSFIKTGKLTKAMGQPLIDAAKAIIAQL